METVTTAILDKFPNLRHRKIWVVLGVAVFGYLGGLGFTTNVMISYFSERLYFLITCFNKHFLEWNVLAATNGQICS